MKYFLLVTSGFTLGSSMIYFWYHEMFSDNPVGEFGRAFDTNRGKNFTALSQPAGGISFVLGALALIGPMVDPNIFSSRHGHSPFWSYWTAVLVLPSMLFMFIALIGIIPFTLPEWMYPEYHAAKREEQRRQEAAERGESEDRDPFLDDDGVYASQLGNVPVDIPEAVGLPSTSAPHSLQTVPSAGSPLPPQGAPALHGPDAAPAPTRAPPTPSTSQPLSPRCPAPGRPPATARGPPAPRAHAGATAARRPRPPEPGRTPMGTLDDYSQQARDDVRHAQSQAQEVAQYSQRLKRIRQTAIDPTRSVAVTVDASGALLGIETPLAPPAVLAAIVQTYQAARKRANFALIDEARKSFGADSRIVRRLEDDLETVDPSRDRRPFQADRYRAERERRRAERESYGY